jgi:hypothetical protein
VYRDISSTILSTRNKSCLKPKLTCVFHFWKIIYHKDKNVRIWGFHNNAFSDLSRIEYSDIDNSVDLSRKLMSRLYYPKGKSKRCHIDLNKLRVKLATVKDSTLVRLPPKKRTLVCLHIVIFDICPVCNHIVTEV